MTIKADNVEEMEEMVEGQLIAVDEIVEENQGDQENQDDQKIQKEVHEKYIEELKPFYDISAYEEWLAPFRESIPRNDGEFLSSCLFKISVHLQGMRASLEHMPNSYENDYYKIMEKVFSVLYDFFEKALQWQLSEEYLENITYDTSDGHTVKLTITLANVVFGDVDAQDRQVQKALSLLISGEHDTDFEILRVIAGEIQDNYYLFSKHNQGEFHFSETWLAVSFTPDDLKSLFTKYFIVLPDKETNDQLLYVYEQLAYGIATLIITTESDESKEFVELLSNSFMDKYDLVRIVAEEMRYHTTFYQQNSLIRNMLYSGNVVDRKIASGYMLEMVAISDEKIMMLANMGGESAQELFKDYALVMSTLQQQLLSFQFRLSVMNRKHRDLVIDYYESISDNMDENVEEADE